MLLNDILRGKNDSLIKNNLIQYKFALEKKDILNNFLKLPKGSDWRNELNLILL